VLLFFSCSLTHKGQSDLPRAMRGKRYDNQFSTQEAWRDAIRTSPGLYGEALIEDVINGIILYDWACRLE